MYKHKDAPQCTAELEIDSASGIYTGERIKISVGRIFDDFKGTDDERVVESAVCKGRHPIKKHDEEKRLTLPTGDHGKYFVVLEEKTDKGSKLHYVSVLEEGQIPEKSEGFTHLSEYGDKAIYFTIEDLAKDLRAIRNRNRKKMGMPPLDV